MTTKKFVPQRYTLTEEEHIKLVEVSNEFGKKITKIIVEALHEMPPDLVDLTVTHLMENHGSFYHAFNVEWVNGLPRLVLPEKDK